MKTVFYILGSVAFGTLILISKPLPREPSLEFQAKRDEMVLKERKLNESIINVENELAVNKILMQSHLDSVNVNKK